MKEREVPSFGRPARQPASADGNVFVALLAGPLPRIPAGDAVAAAVAYGLAQVRPHRRAA